MDKPTVSPPHFPFLRSGRVVFDLSSMRLFLLGNGLRQELDPHEAMTLHQILSEPPGEDFQGIQLAHVRVLRIPFTMPHPYITHVYCLIHEQGAHVVLDSQRSILSTRLRQKARQWYAARLPVRRYMIMQILANLLNRTDMLSSIRDFCEYHGSPVSREQLDALTWDIDATDGLMYLATHGEIELTLSGASDEDGVAFPTMDNYLLIVHAPSGHHLSIVLVDYRPVLDRSEAY